MCRPVPCTFRRISSLFLFSFFGNIAVFAVDCPECKQIYPDFTRLVVHCALEHELWLCPKCQKTFHSKDKKPYWNHRAKTHGEAVCFACNLRVFRDKNEWEHHRKKHEEKVLSLSNAFSCCPEMPACMKTVWVLELHTAHRHGSFFDFLCGVRPLHKCCESCRNDVFKAYYSPKHSKKTFLESMKDFSEHVCKVHHLCFFCERELGDTDMFGRQTIHTDFFLTPRRWNFLSKTDCFICFCGKTVRPNTESQLFALKIDRLPFGTGLDTVTHPFYCIIDGGKNEKEEPPEKLKAGIAMPSKSDESTRKYSDEPKGNFLKTPQSPSFSTKSVETTFASTDDKKHKKLFVSDSNAVPLTGNGTNGDVFENL